MNRSTRILTAACAALALSATLALAAAPSPVADPASAAAPAGSAGNWSCPGYGGRSPMMDGTGLMGPAHMGQAFQGMRQAMLDRAEAMGHWFGRVTGGAR